MAGGEQPIILTSAEQRLAWLEALKRPLTADESAELQRALHAIYCRNRKREMADA